MHVGHAARDHKLSRQEWQGPLSDRWNANREAWNAVRNLAPYKTLEEIAAYFNADISKWGPHIEYRVADRYCRVHGQRHASMGRIIHERTTTTQAAQMARRREAYGAEERTSLRGKRYPS